MRSTQGHDIKNMLMVVANPSAHAIADGSLITGQQQNSGAEAARLVIMLSGTRHSSYGKRIIKM